jgi:hypothetical protein
MANWTAITGIVVSGVVGPSVGAYVGAKNRRRQFEDDIAADDRRELRERLDGAAITLNRLDVTHLDLSSKLRDHGMEVATAAKKTVDLTQWEAENAEQHAERLRIRLGLESPIPGQLERAARSLRDYVEACRAASSAGTGPAEEQASLTKSQIAEARIAFLASAHEVLGDMLHAGPASRRPSAR